MKTEKRNIIVGQSGGPTAAINSSLAGVYRSAKERGYKKVYGMIHGVQGLMKGHYIDLSEHIQSGLDEELLKRTPAAYLGSCRFQLPEIHEDREVGCPKTIDNDLALTDHTPGYGSAAKYIGTSVKEIIRDGMSILTAHGTVTIVEIMGRNAGWLTGAACLAEGEDCQGPDAIYLPEIAFDVDKFVAKCQELLTKKNSVVVCVSEGIKTADGKFVMELGDGVDYVDAFGHKQLSGTARVLANILSARLGCKTRAIELSTLQRAASHSASRIDILEASEVGGAALAAADEGDTGKMVVFVRTSDDPYQANTEVKDVHKIANEERLVPRNWVNEEGTYVTDEFIRYVRPLIRGDVPPIMVDGIPRHLYREGYEDIISGRYFEDKE